MERCWLCRCERPADGWRMFFGRDELFCMPCIRIVRRVQQWLAGGD